MALILTLRVLLLPFFSVRRLLLFAVLPTILTPFFIGIHHFGIDYHALWIGDQTVTWVCTIGVAHSLVTGMFRKLPGVGKVFGYPFACALAAAFCEAAYESQYLSRLSLESLTSGAIVLGRAILIATGLFVASVLGIAFWSRVNLPKNFASLLLVSRYTWQFKLLEKYAEACWSPQVCGLRKVLRSSGSCSSPTGSSF